jgi:hypothetical protein
LLADIVDHNAHVVKKAARALVTLLGARDAVKQIVADCRKRSEEKGISFVAFALK